MYVLSKWWWCRLKMDAAAALCATEMMTKVSPARRQSGKA
jgi:hypothetical protein